MTTKLNKFMETVLSKSKPVLDPVKEKDTLVHDGSKESDRILRSFIPFVLNKKRQYDNNLRAAYATGMGVFKNPLEVSKKRNTTLPLIKKAASKKQKALPSADELKESKEAPKEGEGSLSDFTENVPASSKTKEKSKSEKSETPSSTKGKQTRVVSRSKKSEEEISEEEQRQKELENTVRMGETVDTNIFDSMANLWEEYHQAVKRMYDAEKPGYQPEAYEKRVDAIQDKISEKLSHALVPFVTFYFQDFLDGDLDANPLDVLELKYKEMGSKRIASHSISMFKDIISRVNQVLSEDKEKPLRNYGRNIFRGSPDEIEQYDFNKDYKDKFNLKKLAGAVKTSIFRGKGENYGDLIDDVFNSKVGSTMQQISKKPNIDKSKNSLSYLRDIFGNFIGTIPDNTMNFLDEHFKNYPDLINELPANSAKRIQMEQDYAKYEHINKTMKKVIGYKKTGKLNYRDQVVNKVLPEFEQVLEGKNILNEDFLNNVDKKSQKQLRNIMAQSINKPKEFTNGIFMQKYSDAFTAIRKADLDKEDSTFSNWLSHGADNNDLAFYMKMFDSIAYFGREYYPGSSGSIFSSIDDQIHRMEQGVILGTAQEHEPELLKSLQNYRDVLVLEDYMLKDKNVSLEEIKDMKQNLSDKNLSNSYAVVEDLDNQLARYGAKRGARFGDINVEDATNKDVNDMIEKINEINDFFKTGEPKAPAFDGQPLLARVSDLGKQGEQKLITKLIDEFNTKTYDPAKKNMNDIDRISRKTGLTHEEVMEQLEEHKGFTPENLLKLENNKFNGIAEDILNAHKVSENNKDILKGNSIFGVNKNELTKLQSNYEAQEKEAVKNVGKNFETIVEGLNAKRVTAEEFKQWKEDPTKAEHFMRDIVATHFELEKIRLILQKKPFDTMNLKFNEFMDKNFLPLKNFYYDKSVKVGADMEKVGDEILKYGDNYMSQEHREEIEKSDNAARELQQLEEVQNMLNSKISQEMYENQGVMKNNEFFKYVEDEDGNPDLDLYRLNRNKDGVFVEEKVKQKEIKQREDDIMTVVPQLGEHLNLNKKKKNIVRKFVRSLRDYNKSKSGTIKRGLYGRRVHNLKEKISDFLPEDIVSGLEGVSRITFKDHKDSSLSKILKGTEKNPEVRLTNSFISDPYSGFIQGVHGENLVEIANRTDQEGNAYVVPKSPEGQKTAIVGGKFFIGNPEDPEGKANLTRGLYPDQNRYMRNNQNLRKITEAEDTGNDMRYSDDIKALHGTPDYSSLTDYGQGKTKLKLQKPIDSMKSGKGKTLEGLGSVIGRVFKEDDESWLEVIE